MGRPHERARRGGVIGWPSARVDILSKLREPELFVTTMVDFYAMPQSPPNGWSGRAGAAGTSSQRANLVQNGMATDIAKAMGQSFDPRRFVPYVAMHEFEALLFSDPRAFAAGLDAPKLEPDFRKILDACGAPEEIDDSPMTAPSKRILAVMPGYQKPLFGNTAALEVGLPAMRASCPNFNEWIERLENLR